MKIKKEYLILILILLFISGCGSQSIVNSKISNNATNKQDNFNKGKSISFKYAFTGFISVKDIYNDLPIGTRLLNTQEEWTKFKNIYLPYENIPWPSYSGDIDFTKDSVVYYSILDAKADFYAQAWQIDKITLENQQVNIFSKDIEGNLKITATNHENFGGHRYVIIVTISKNDLENLK